MPPGAQRPSQDFTPHACLTRLFHAPHPRHRPVAARCFLHHLSADNLIKRLQEIKRSFTRALVIGPGAEALVTFLHAQGVRVDAIPAVLEDEAWPRAAFDLICLNLNLHWVNDVPGLLIQIRHSLVPDGIFLGSFLGQDTLHELKKSFLQAEIQGGSGVRCHVAPLIDLATAAQLLQRARFALPVVDRDRQWVHYQDARHLMRDLQRMGERNRSLYRPAGLYSPRQIARMCDYYATHFCVEDHVVATFDLCYMTGWAPAETATSNPSCPAKPAPRLTFS